MWARRGNSKRCFLEESTPRTEPVNACHPPQWCVCYHAYKRTDVKKQKEGSPRDARHTKGKFPLYSLIRENKRKYTKRGNSIGKVSSLLEAKSFLKHRNMQLQLPKGRFHPLEMVHHRVDMLDGHRSCKLRVRVTTVQKIRQAQERATGLVPKVMLA